jgi:hypothetical protein
LGLFGDIPVGYYTGVPNISIPIYTIKSGDITLPITLDYHASGIKVAQEASWVGLGWALNAGGVITRTVCGFDDFGTYPVGFYYKEPLKNVGPDNSFDPTNAMDSYNYYRDIEIGESDGEPDIFYFNFNGYAGKFYFNKRDNNSLNYAVPICSSKNDLDIKYFPNTQTWVVIDGKGYKYYFGTKELTKSYSAGTTSQFDNPDLFYPPRSSKEPTAGIVSSWYLDKIESPTGDVVTFKYDTKIYSVMSQIQFHENINKLISIKGSDEGSNNNSILSKIWKQIKSVFVFDIDDGFVSSEQAGIYKQYGYSRTLSHDVYLSEIVFNGGKILFDKSDRTDLIYYKDPDCSQSYNAQKLDKIIIQDNSQKNIMSCGFEYTYFKSNQNQLDDRLKLNSIKFFDSNDKNNPPYTFSYNNGSLPKKTSNAIDHWGLYNGKGNTREWGSANFDINSNKITFIPTVDGIIDGYVVKMNGADREPDSVKMQYGILNSIKYPTGGETSFFYEPHSYSNFTPYYVNNYTSTGVSAGYNVKGYSSLNNTEFMITEAQDVELNSSMTEYTGITNYRESSDKTGCSFNLTVDGTYARLFKLDNNNNPTLIKEFIIYGGGQYINYSSVNDYSKSSVSAYCNGGYYYSHSEIAKVSLEPGKYRIEAVAIHPDTKDESVYSISAKYISSKSLINKQIGGGLRIRKIENNDGVNSYFKTFNYNSYGSLSSGRLMSIPVYTYFCTKYESTTNSNSNYDGLYIIVTSNSRIPIGYSASGSPVGYDVVTEEVGGSGEAGKNKYYYNNRADEVNIQCGGPTENIVPGTPTYSYLNNGLLNQKEVFDKDGNLIRKEEYNYSKNNLYTASVKGVKIYKFLDCKNYGVQFYDRYSEWWKLDNSITTDYSDPNKPITQQTDYVYNTVNLLSNKITTTSSTGKTFEKQITYPSDIATVEPYKSMTAKNMIEYPVETREYNDGKLVKAELNTYESTYFLPYEKYSLETTTPISSYVPFNGTINSTYYKSPLMQYTKYNSIGRVVEMVDKSGLYTCYLWGYNYQYPIAEIKNATYDQVSGALQGITADQLAVSSTPDITKVDALRSTLPNTLITTYTYIPLVGMVTAKDPRGVVTSYNYDSFNRLMNVIDFNGKTLKSFDYHYKQ